MPSAKGVVPTRLRIAVVELCRETYTSISDLPRPQASNTFASIP
ncbi:hypothetical protein [Streptomyces sp. SID486]|nr:hypothetical protein [Streptomyces sp. SID486]